MTGHRYITGISALRQSDERRDKAAKVAKVPDDLLEAATAGNPEAQYRLGFDHYNLLGVDEAFNWIEKAANAGHASAQMFLGMNYYFGGAIIKNAAVGMKWLNLGSESDPRWQPRVCHRMLRLFMNSKNRKHADAMTREWKAARISSG